VLESQRAAGESTASGVLAEPVALSEAAS
jgi:hypothetical protein